MGDYKTRLIEEQKELNEKVDTLIEFIMNSNSFSTLTEESQFLLRTQFQAMTLHNNVLKQRIKLLG